MKSNMLMYITDLLIKTGHSVEGIDKGHLVFVRPEYGLDRVYYDSAESIKGRKAILPITLGSIRTPGYVHQLLENVKKVLRDRDYAAYVIDTIELSARRAGKTPGINIVEKAINSINAEQGKIIKGSMEQCENSLFSVCESINVIAKNLHESGVPIAAHLEKQGKKVEEIIKEKGTTFGLKENPVTGLPLPAAVSGAVSKVAAPKIMTKA